MTNKNTSIEGLTRYDHQGCCMAPDETGDYLLISDVRALLASQAEPAELTGELLARLIDENTDRDFGLLVEPFARAVLRESTAPSPSQPHQAVVAAGWQMELVEQVRTAMRRAYDLGQKYWQQADSDYTSEWKKSEATAQKFVELNESICAMLATPAAPVEQAPVLADPVLATWPTRIWLQWNPDEREEYPGASEDLTWCSSNVHPSDVEYLRADLAAAPAAGARDQALEEAALLCEQIGTDWLEADDAHKNFAADYLAKAIRALRTTPVGAGDGGIDE